MTMQRALLLILLLAAACGRRELATGNWTGVARPDATVPGTPPAADNGGPLSKGVDAAPTGFAVDAGALGAGPVPIDGSVPPRGPETAPGTGNPMVFTGDAGSDTGDARSCPETGSCD
jgi:hypothetical protein